MTTLDRAFIKAFAASAPPALAEDKTAVPLRSSNATETKRAPGAPKAFDAADSSAPAPDPLSPPLPLSSFARQPQVQDSFRALLEIDRAAFPAACGELLGRAGHDWDRFTEQLIEQMGQGQKCIAVTGIARGDGSTTVSLTLAKHVAARGLRPVVVDADPQNPALARSCGVSVQTGWNDLVSSELPLGEALIMAVEDGVTLMPWRGGGVPLAQLTESLRTASIFGTLREHYDLVLLDMMPLEAPTSIAELTAFAGAIRLDALYLIHNVRTTSREQLIATCSKLRGAGLPLAAVIENFVSPRIPGEPSGRDESPAAAGHRMAAHG
jgi:Mrp family chromosome partitioning ATPase